MLLFYFRLVHYLRDTFFLQQLYQRVVREEETTSYAVSEAGIIFITLTLKGSYNNYIVIDAP